jgi:hypothetical protein
VARYRQLLFGSSSALDVRSYSKALHRGGGYDFKLDRLLGRPRAS